MDRRRDRSPPRKPADVSAASKEPNEYIPTFISKKPFYVDDVPSTDYLEHQRLHKDQVDQSAWYERGKRAGPAATKYRKGACANCGAMSHRTKECLSRPRKAGARWTGKDIQADETIKQVDLGWDAKRDRWNGWSAEEYGAVMAQYEDVERLREQRQRQQQQQQDQSGDGAEGDGSDGGDDARYAEEAEMGRSQSKGTKNLRLREDTAKYLVNLDLDSARYDPKTRAMVDAGATADRAAALVAEEQFMRSSGDAADFERAQRYAWEAQERGQGPSHHIQANPTSGEYRRRQEEAERERRVEAERRALREKYGDGDGEETARAAAAVATAPTAVTASERYVEYDENGMVKGGPAEAEAGSTKSRYAEDVFPNNHSSVWGSWWSRFAWGYACCHSTVKNSYCTGEAGKAALDEAGSMPDDGMRIEGAKRTREAEAEGQVEGEAEAEATREVEATTKRAEKAQSEIGGTTEDREGKKRRLREMQGAGVTEDELEQYRRKRAAADDPMAAYLAREGGGGGDGDG